MRYAMDIFSDGKVDATTCNVSYTVSADSHRFFCAYCSQFVFFSPAGIKTAYFGHSKNSPECEEKAARNESTASRYYNPDTSFGLPVYLVGNHNKSLKIGFLQRNNGRISLLGNHKIYSKENVLLTYDVGNQTRNHYIYLNLTKYAPMYYISFNSKVYYGEGLGDINIFLDKTRRRIRMKENKECLILEYKYLLMIKRNSEIYFKLSDSLENVDLFSEHEEILFDKEYYDIYTFIPTKSNEDLLKIIRNEFKLQIKNSPFEINFLWPFNFSYYDNKNFLYDDELYIKTKRVDLIKFTSDNRTIKQTNNEEFFKKVHDGSVMIAWNEASGAIFNINVCKKIDYSRKSKSLIYFFDPKNKNKIEDFDIEKYDKIGVYSNVKCKMVKIGNTLSTTKLETTNGESEIEKIIDISDLKELCILYQNRVVLKLSKPKTSVNKRLDIKRALLLAQEDSLKCKVNPELKKYLSLINNNALVIEIKNNLLNGMINESLQNYLMEVFA